MGEPTVGKGGNSHRYCQAVSSQRLQKRETTSPFQYPTLSQGTTVVVLALVIRPSLGQSLWPEEWNILPSKTPRPGRARFCLVDLCGLEWDECVPEEMGKVS